MPTFRQIATSAPSGTAANTTVAKPAGTLDNDIMIAAIYVEADQALTVPAGWTQILDIDHAAATFDCWIYWKRAAGEGASWTWSHGSTWQMGAVASYIGCKDTGDPQDAAATSNQGTSTTGTATGLTTVTDNAMLVGVFASFEGISAQAAGPSSMTERFDAGNEDIYWADVSQAAAGPSGNKVLGTALSAANHWVASLIALTASGAGAAAPAAAPVLMRSLRGVGF